MICVANEVIRTQVRDMWKRVFGDSDAYMDIYFREKYSDENTLVYMEDGKAVASLQMLPYLFTFCGAEIPILYLSGVCTLPEYRRKGYTRQLLMRSFEEAVRRDVALVLLVPQEEWLLDFYNRFGFAQTFDPGDKEPVSLKELVTKYPCDLRKAYQEFDGLFRLKDVTVQKSFDDFRVVIEEAALYDYPPVKNLIGMSRIVDVKKLLSLFAAYYENKSFSVDVRDEILGINNGVFSVSGGKVESISSLVSPQLSVDIACLARLLLGYHTSKLSEPFCSLFPEKEPQMHFMLE